ncbi:putative tubulin polyglutamylase ttll2 [Terramyces sp. JEL0728]|nr:putative tubulin polyglutamylase ttll2 [Terramyces sp. JEL0728]
MQFLLAIFGAVQALNGQDTIVIPPKCGGPNKIQCAAGLECVFASFQLSDPNAGGFCVFPGTSVNSALFNLPTSVASPTAIATTVAPTQSAAAVQTSAVGYQSTTAAQTTTSGWIAYEEGQSNYWNLYWKGTRFRKADYEECQSFQRLNHFPKTSIITKKDTLVRLLRTMKFLYGSVYDFFPLSFSVPTEFKKYMRYVHQEDERGEKSIWICKPADLSRGRGIFVFRELHELSYDCNAVVQKYISNPLLISGYKFDIRCYVLVRSYNPLVIYLYQDGLTRFATEPYGLNNLGNMFSHLTNTSINKLSPTLNQEKDDVGPGCKWNFEKLKDHLNGRNIDFDEIWERIKALVILTMLPVAQEVPPQPQGCFELYGFDFIIDSNLKTWILEINLSPALSVDTQIDVQVKRPLLLDMMLLLDLAAEDGDLAHEYKSQLDKSKLKMRRTRLAQPPPTVQTKNLWAPSKCGRYQKIFPSPELNHSLDPLPKVGDVIIVNSAKNESPDYRNQEEI